MTAGRSHKTVVDFKADMVAHGGDPDRIEHVCMDMSAAYTKGVTEALPKAQISYDRFHVIALANEAMDAVRREEMQTQPRVVRAALGPDRKAIKGMVWGMRKDPSDWNKNQMNTMYYLQRSNLKSARAWRLKQGLRQVYAQGVAGNCEATAKSALQGWISWARRCRLEPFKKLAMTIKKRLPGVVRGMLDGRSNAYVKAMNGLLQQTNTAARGFRTVKNFVAIAYLRMSKLKHLPQNLCDPPYHVEMALPNIVMGGKFHTERHRAFFLFGSAARDSNARTTRGAAGNSRRMRRACAAPLRLQAQRLSDSTDQHPLPLPKQRGATWCTLLITRFQPSAITNQAQASTEECATCASITSRYPEKSFTTFSMRRCRPTPLIGVKRHTRIIWPR